MKIRKILADLVLQIIPVMIGVYLGFIVSNWSSERQLIAKTKILKKNIIIEIKENQNSINSILSYHEMLRDSSQYYLSQKKLVIPSFFKGVNPLTLSNSAFETGVQTGLINELTFDEIQALNKVYTYQKSYDNYWNILLSGLITFDLTENEESSKKFLMYLSISMTDIVIKEQQLINEYKIILSNTNTKK